MQVERLEEGSPGKYRVTSKAQDNGSEVVGDYNTVRVVILTNICIATFPVNLFNMTTIKNQFD